MINRFLHRCSPLREAAGLTRRDALRALALALTGVALPGCGYIVGNPYPQNLRTVHVPTFTNETFRRGFELQLTEAVQRQVTMRTPFQLAGPDRADTRLIGHIRSVDKRPTNQNRFDDPRELELSIALEIRWENVRTGEVIARDSIPCDAAIAHLVVNSSFAPETGQSLATATQQAVDDLARQIVGLMEGTW